MEIEENNHTSNIEDELKNIVQFYSQNNSEQQNEQQIILDEQDALNLIKYNLENNFYQQAEDLDFYQTTKEFLKLIQKGIDSSNSSINLMSIQEFEEECKQEEKKGFQKVTSNLKNNLTKILMKNQLAFLHFLIVFIRLKKLENVSLYFKKVLINYSKQTNWILFLDFHESKLIFDLFRSQFSSVQTPNQIFFLSSVENYPTKEQIEVIEFYFQKKHSWKEQLQFFQFTKFDISTKIFDILNNLEKIDNMIKINFNNLEEKIIQKILTNSNALGIFMQICNENQELDYYQREVKFEEVLKI